MFFSLYQQISRLQKNLYQTQTSNYRASLVFDTFQSDYSNVHLLYNCKDMITIVSVVLLEI